MTHAQFIIALCNDLYDQYMRVPEGHSAAGDAILVTANTIGRAAAKVGIDVILRDFRPFQRPVEAASVLTDEQVAGLVWPPEGWQSAGIADGVAYWYKGAEIVTDADLRARVGT